MLSVYDFLTRIYAEAGEERANAWPGKPNKAFEGLSAVEVILAGDIERVRRYLRHHVYNA